jgi:hypothetical protein
MNSRPQLSIPSPISGPQKSLGGPLGPPNFVGGPKPNWWLNRLQLFFFFKKFRIGETNLVYLTIITDLKKLISRPI